MMLAEKMKVAKALRTYADSKGYTGKKGRQPAGIPNYSSYECSAQFKLSLLHARLLLSCIEANVNKVPNKAIDKVATCLESLKQYNPALSELDDKFDPDDTEAPMISDIKNGKAKELLAEMPSDLHVSNRLYSVEGKVKEVVDYIKQYKLHYKAILESLRTLRPLSEDTLLEGDPWFLEYEVTLIRIIHHLDIVIQKLENI